VLTPLVRRTVQRLALAAATDQTQGALWQKRLLSLLQVRCRCEGLARLWVF
jgi:hypothetical protein